MTRLAVLASTRVLLAGLITAGPAAAQTSGQSNAPSSGQSSDPRFFAQTGYRIENDAFSDFFQQRGNAGTIGYPVSPTFPLDGFRVQDQRKSTSPPTDLSGVQRLDGHTSVGASTLPGETHAKELAQELCR